MNILQVLGLLQLLAVPAFTVSLTSSNITVCTYMSVVNIAERMLGTVCPKYQDFKKAKYLLSYVPVMMLFSCHRASLYIICYATCRGWFVAKCSRFYFGAPTVVCA